MKQLRCAIYTRKSSEEGLEQDFNSLDAQQEACEAYIKSQKHEGWELVEKQYNDGGFSGGTMNRPAFIELLKDIEKGEIDVVVVYKVDRLTRSLMDFAKIVDVFDKHETSFVSITQQFNTTTSMGRLTLNILLSFAQFEREVTGERIRDKFAASKKKGMWINGKPPMGYVKKDGRLEVEPNEAKIIRMIFDKYLEIGTVPALVDFLKTNKIYTHSGKNFYKGHLYRILSNKTYIGKIVHKNNVYRGLHEPIIDFYVFEKTQQLLAHNALIRKNSTNAESGSLLKGKLFDDKDNYMSPTHSCKNGKRYRYYVSQAQIQNRLQDIGSVLKISAGEIENFVTDKIKEIISDKTLLQELFKDYSITQQKLILEQINIKTIDVNFIRHSLIKTKISEPSIVDDILLYQELYQEISAGVDRVNYVSSMAVNINNPLEITIKTANDLIAKDKDLYILEILVSEAIVILKRIFDSVIRCKEFKKYDNSLTKLLDKNTINIVKDCERFLNSTNEKRWKYQLKDIIKH